MREQRNFFFSASLFHWSWLKNLVHSNTTTLNEGHVDVCNVAYHKHILKVNFWRTLPVPLSWMLYTSYKRLATAVHNTFFLWQHMYLQFTHTTFSITFLVGNTWRTTKVGRGSIPCYNNSKRDKDHYVGIISVIILAVCLALKSIHMLPSIGWLWSWLWSSRQELVWPWLWQR